MQNYRISHGLLEVDSTFSDFLLSELAPGSSIDIDSFWNGLEQLLADLQPKAKALLALRDDLQAQIDQWHNEQQSADYSQSEYVDFLRQISYLLPRPTDVHVRTQNVDPEIASIAGPQLVVPVDNARYALNAANARWGSLYDALYGSDVINEDDGAHSKGPYNPKRGEKVITFARELLDTHFPLLEGSHHSSTSYFVKDSALAVTIEEGETSLYDGEQFVGFTGSKERPISIILQKHGLHVELLIDPNDQIGSSDSASIADIYVESALTSIMDCEDSVAAVDAEDKVKAYRNWLGLMKGDLEIEFVKGGISTTRSLTPNSTFTTPEGRDASLKRRGLMLVRNVGMHLETNIVSFRGQPISETILDGIVTAWCGIHDIRSTGLIKNSYEGSIYIVKPKMHGPDEVAFAVELFSRIEDLLELPENTLKIGIMDEERRTSVNLLACIDAAKDRVVFINTGFLDRTGDEIHTSMEAGPFVPKTEMKEQPWLSAYEDLNVEEGLSAGLLQHGQIGKGMWARPDDMAAMLEEKIEHPESGASCAWVPSPTAATLHALHYFDVDVTAIQAGLEGERSTPREAMLQIPLLEDGRELSPDEISAELRNNAQGILGYVARWVGQGVGCSKVPDINDIQLMEDRATLRISSQHIANWLRHGIVSQEEVLVTMAEMAEIVDRQNDGDEDYKAMSVDLSASIPYQAAIALVLEGANQPNGYTEFLLTERRQKMKETLGLV
jgi:malate synthase